METRREARSTGGGLLARNLVIALGAWLFATPFLWRHGSTSTLNSFGCGVLIVLTGITATYVPRTRFVNTGLAVWLGYSAVTWEHLRTLTAANNAVVAILVFALSLLFPSAPRHTERAPAA